MNEPLPEMLKKYFWDCDFQDMRMEKYAFFIAERILNLGDLPALKWLIERTDRDFLKKVLKKSRNLDKKTTNYLKMMLHGNEPVN